MGEERGDRALRATPAITAGGNRIAGRDPHVRKSRCPAAATDQQPLRPEDLCALGLTLRQAEVLAWLAFGKTDPDIARILDISPRTVSHTVGRIYRKLGVETRVAATLRAVRLIGAPAP